MTSILDQCSSLEGWSRGILIGAKGGSVMDFAQVKDVATVVGTLVGASSLVVAALNLAATRRSNQARFWLDLRNHFARHDEVHMKLRPGGSWSEKGAGPQTQEEWAK